MNNDDVVDDEAGIGLIEIVISMFLVALIAMAFLPLLIRTYSTTSLNTTTATATQLLDANVDAIRTKATAEPTCLALTSFVAATPSTITDERGITYEPHRSLVCPAGYPGTAEARVWITELGDLDVVAEATTLLYLTRATP